jgi:IS5 family transposase
MLKVWLYAYAVGITSSRRLEERIREDLALRYLAGGAEPDYWALNDFRRRHKLLEEIPGRLERLKKSGMKKLSRADGDSRFLRQRQGYVLGYAGTIAVSEDHLIVAQQVSQAGADNELLVPMVERVEQQCGERPGQVSADSGFFSQDDVRAMEEKGIDAYVPDSHMAHELNCGRRVRSHGATRDPAQQRMRQKLRSAVGRAIYAKCKQIVEPRFGNLKEQHGMRRFRLRGLAKTTVEFTLAHTALNLLRLGRKVPAPVGTA